ncbi:hypothetical protein L6452_05890 [Arctium lappa]|uniref:Uncharacterized protein n=1 Tax=Arctium lappa TaxID=4217 RepID=A0ACB9EI42_ARCLA|nr:hypothetical protein L6452_05890 [Arctium lappa]
MPYHFPQFLPLGGVPRSFDRSPPMQGSHQVRSVCCSIFLFFDFRHPYFHAVVARGEAILNDTIGIDEVLAAKGIDL